MWVSRFFVCIALAIGVSTPVSAHILQVTYSGYLSNIATCINCITHTVDKFSPGEIPWAGSFTINTDNGMFYSGAFASMSKQGGTGSHSLFGLPPITSTETSVGSLNFGTADSLGNDESIVSVNDRAVYGTAQFYTIYITEDDAYRAPSPGQLPNGNREQLGVNLMSPAIPFTFDQDFSLTDPAGFGVNTLFYSSTTYNFGCASCYKLVGYNGILTSITVRDTSLSVPEPSTWTLLVLGLFGVGFASRGLRRNTVSRFC